ncbi:hypothetical protein SSX86_001806 [Deinandra increscens subsp. villosa]|uniref:Uncharacterized protein n=1 Tax=Deinandra increscens subsp. villosa TaxID=3103831 RepID=A0AAP0HCY9_9ASTR
MLRHDQSSGSKKNWKSFRDKLCLKRTGKAWISSIPTPTSDVLIQGKYNRMMTKRGCWRYPTDTDADAVGGSDGSANLQLGHMLERYLPQQELPEEGAVAVVGKKTQETLIATDAIIEALDIATEELKRIAEYENVAAATKREVAIEINEVDRVIDYCDTRDKFWNIS